MRTYSGTAGRTMLEGAARGEAEKRNGCNLLI